MDSNVFTRNDGLPDLNRISHLVEQIAEIKQQGKVRVNQGAKDALTSNKSSSLLPVNILNIEAEFKKSEVIKLIDEQHGLTGLGIAEYGSDKSIEIIGKKKTRNRLCIMTTFI